MQKVVFFAVVKIIFEKRQHKNLIMNSTYVNLVLQRMQEQVVHLLKPKFIW